jgi:cytoskeleton protein RodZ
MADEIGARLREARMHAQLVLNEVEARTKIRAKYLRAIENEEWDLLPGEVYVKSFLRTYGDFLGLDTRQLLDDYRRRYGRPSDHELRPITPLGRERERQARGPLLPPWALIGIVLVAVVVVLVIIGNNNNKPKTPLPVNTRAGVTHHRTRSGHHRAKPKLTPRPHNVRLQLVPTGPVNVCLVDGHGRKLIPGLTFDVGQTIPVETRNKLLLTLGNNSVKMKVNGATVVVAPSARPIGYELLPGSHRLLPASRQPTCT